MNSQSKMRTSNKTVLFIWRRTGGGQAWIDATRWYVIWRNAGFGMQEALIRCGAITRRETCDAEF